MKTRRVALIASVGLFAFVSIAGAQGSGLGLKSHTTYATGQMIAPPESRVSALSFRPVDTSIPIAPTSGAGLIIAPTFDASITGNVNKTAIENAINSAISVLQARFKDPITVYIYFRFASTDPVSSVPLSAGTLGQSYHFFYFNYTWTQYRADLVADKTTSYDTTA